MKAIFTKKVLIFLFVCAIVVLSIALFSPVNEPTDESVGEESSSEEVLESEEFSLGNFFSVKTTPGAINPKQLPPDIKPDEACIVEGEVVKEGTVASNTICINETPTPTFTVTPTPTVTPQT